MGIGIIFNSLLALVDLGAFVWLRRSPRGGRVLGAGAAVLVGGGLVAVGLGEDRFGALRLFTYTVFGHLAILLLLTGVTLMRSAGRIALTCVIAFVMLQVVAVDAFLVEPRWLEVSKVSIASSKLEHSVRIALVADIQTDNVGDHENGAVSALVAQEPDLILLAGDYLQVPTAEFGTAATQLRDALRPLTTVAPLGIFAVQGNVDPPAWKAVFDGLDIETMDGISSRDIGPLVLSGLGVDDSFNPTASVPPQKKFHVAFGHSPDFALGHIEADLLLAGHTHGGQVRLPFLGPALTLSRVPRDWAAGVTDLGGDRTLIVSRGVGMERGHAPRLRFLCRPEIVIVDAHPA